MLPELPHALNPEFQVNFPHREAEGEVKVDHHCQVCPCCSQRLSGHRCKLVCTGCGYYLSCADYY